MTRCLDIRRDYLIFLCKWCLVSASVVSLMHSITPSSSATIFLLCQWNFWNGTATLIAWYKFRYTGPLGSSFNCLNLGNDTSKTEHVHFAVNLVKYRMCSSYHIPKSNTCQTHKEASYNVSHHSDYKEYTSDPAVCVKTARRKNTVELIYILYLTEFKYCRIFRPFT
jgi:hypothetical protein